jgi:signal transduction histidine kinase
MLQLLIALVSGSLAHARNPLLNAACALLFLSLGILITAVLIRSHTPVVPWLAWADVAVMTLIMLAQIEYSPVETRYSTWDAWGYGVAQSTALFLGIAIRPPRRLALALGTVSASYVVSVAPAAHAAGQAVTVYANAMGYFLNAVLAWWIWGYLVRLGRRSDFATELAAQAERQKAESDRRVLEERHRADQRVLAARHQAVAFALHDEAGLLAGLLREWRESDPAAIRATLEQLEGSVRSSRQLLDGDAPRERRTLGGALQSVAQSFPSLHVTCTSDLVDDLKLDQPLLDALVPAIRTLLTNVSRHAQTKEAQVHGSISGTGEWEVTVNDRGIGMDVRKVIEGYGLRTQVREALAPFGVRVEISSEPGLGTCVILTGPIERTR